MTASTSDNKREIIMTIRYYTHINLISGEIIPTYVYLASVETGCWCDARDSRKALWPRSRFEQTRHVQPYKSISRESVSG